LLRFARNDELFFVTSRGMRVEKKAVILRGACQRVARISEAQSGKYLTRSREEVEYATQYVVIPAKAGMTEF